MLTSLYYPGVLDLSIVSLKTWDGLNTKEALEAFKRVSRLEGIIPALETSHALAHLEKRCPTLSDGARVVLNFSGRGDKDVQTAIKYLEKCGHLGHKESRCLGIEKNIAMAAGNSAQNDLDVSNNTPIIAQEASIVSGRASISESVLTTNVRGVFSATNPPISPLRDVSFTEVAAVPETGRVVAVPLVGEKIVQNLQIMYAEHSVPSSFRSGKTTKSRKEASGFTTGSEANVKSLREDSDDNIITDLTTPFTDRLLRDRPVKHSTKVTEMAATLHATRGRGKRGRGRRGGHGRLG
uniref:Uncharacterized protein n=1 Tax=Brassica campestris TaxID=3711 RepID=M4DRC9_BRACM